jgi:TRAP-type uncharacterized transport system substrate-binding protein
MRLTLSRAVGLVCAVAAGFASLAPATAQQSAMVNRGLVQLETTGSDGISVRIAEDLSRLIDDGATRRVVPVIGKTSTQNLIDLKYLRGVDLAIVQLDVIDYVRDRRALPGVDSLTYITKLFNEELHILARSEIKDINGLADQKMSVGLSGSGAEITLLNILGQLKLRVSITHDRPAVAIDKLRRGEIAAIAFVAGKPAPIFTGLAATEGLHFLDIPFTALQNSVYAPTRLTATDYPKLILSDHPINTIAIGSVLLAADLRQLPERYNNIANFVDVFFRGFSRCRGLNTIRNGARLILRQRSRRYGVLNRRRNGCSAMLR